MKIKKSRCEVNMVLSAPALGGVPCRRFVVAFALPWAGKEVAPLFGGAFESSYLCGAVSSMRRSAT